MKPIRFVLVGGFLGAGKTTTMARLARTFIESGKNVGLVTNDQAFDLVDTQSLRNQGFRVGEVAGACFCCKFNDLIATARRLSEDESPDVIIAEPVGSCTDLVATVIEPLRQLHGAEYEIAPLVVLLKPEHGRKILGEESDVGFSQKAAYIFLKQIEEADVVVINKVDKLSDDERDELVCLVSERYPEKIVVAASARTGEGFTEVFQHVSRGERSVREWMELDYDVYADGEAELGWLNCRVRMGCTDASTPSRFLLDDLVFDVVESTDARLRAADNEPVHVKVLGSSKGRVAVANLVGAGAEPELSVASAIDTDEAELIVNARVTADPESLSALVASIMAEVAGRHGLWHEVSDVQCFRPARPEPTHARPIH